MNFKLVAFLLILFFSSGMLFAENTPPVSGEEGSSFLNNTVGASWCVLRQKEATNNPPKCDVGIGSVLYSFSPRLALAGAIGSKTLGFGISWRIGQAFKQPLAVVLGAVVLWDGDGIYLDEIYPALGITLKFGKTL